MDEVIEYMKTFESTMDIEDENESCINSPTYRIMQLDEKMPRMLGASSQSINRQISISAQDNGFFKERPRINLIQPKKLELGDEDDIESPDEAIMPNLSFGPTLESATVQSQQIIQQAPPMHSFEQVFFETSKELQVQAQFNRIPPGYAHQLTNQPNEATFQFHNLPATMDNFEAQETSNQRQQLLTVTRLNSDVHNHQHHGHRSPAPSKSSSNETGLSPVSNSPVIRASPRSILCPRSKIMGNGHEIPACRNNGFKSEERGKDSPKKVTFAENLSFFQYSF